MTRFVFSKPAAGAQRSNQGASETEAERHPFAGERIQITRQRRRRGRHSRDEPNPESFSSGMLMTEC